VPIRYGRSSIQSFIPAGIRSRGVLGERTSPNLATQRSADRARRGVGSHALADSRVDQPFGWRVRARREMTWADPAIDERSTRAVALQLLTWVCERVGGRDSRPR